MARWVDEVPNDGLIYYRFVFNTDRILVTSPKAMGEVLVQKSYDFVKPGFLRAGIAQILGVGILLAEGDEHKVYLQSVLINVQSTDLIPATTQKSHARICFSPCARSISRFLEQVAPVCQHYDP